jgi:outer membrane protein TolC
MNLPFQRPKFNRSPKRCDSGRGSGRGPVRLPFWRRWGWFRPALTLTGALAIVGCATAPNYLETIGNDTTEVDAVMRRVDQRTSEILVEESFMEPHTIQKVNHEMPTEYRDMSLDEVIHVAMTNSQVLRDLGATVLRAPETVSSTYQLALQQTDPRFGMEAALAAFDAQLAASAFFQDNNRVFNNAFFGGGTNNFVQDRHDYLVQLSKRTATGSTLALRHITDYDANNAPGNLFPSAWQTQIEGELRQPLMQGAGLTFNRIAGPGAFPGVSNGILIAKINTDINYVDFERQIRNYVSEVANAYWDLYFAYRDLAVKQAAFERSRETWQAYQAQQQANMQGGAFEAMAREQFYRFESELKDAITGRAGQRTQQFNGASGGVFRGINGVHMAERRLRLLIGMPVSDVELIRPTDEPEMVPVVFNWDSIVGEALKRRPELEEQRLLVKRRELELIAAKNFLNPQLDAVGRYRVRGLGNHLIGGRRANLGGAFDEMGSFGFQEWELGLEYSVPLGFRRGHAAVQNAEFQIAHARAILREQERQVVHDLGAMVAEAARAYEQAQTNLNRYLAARDAVDSLEASREAGLPVNVDQILDAHRRLAESETRYYQSRVEYVLALKNVHFEKGSLLEYNDVSLFGTPDQPITSTVHVTSDETQPAPVNEAILDEFAAFETRFSEGDDSAEEFGGSQVENIFNSGEPAETGEAVQQARVEESAEFFAPIEGFDADPSAVNLDDEIQRLIDATR